MRRRLRPAQQLDRDSEEWIDPAVSRRAWQVLAVNLIVIAQPAMAATMVTIALPQLDQVPGMTGSIQAILVSGYWLVSTVTLLSFGRLADLAGRRGLYLIGTAVFCAAAIGCALAPSAAVLVVFRLIQALGAAAIIANGTALLTDAFPRTLLPTAMGISASAFAAFGLAGPTFGGLLVAGLGPRAIFWFAVPFCLAGLIFGARVLPRPPRRVREPFDPAGALLVAAALTGLMIVLTQGAEWGWLSTTTIAATVLTLMAGAAVVVVELRVRYPLIDIRLFGVWNRAAGYVAFGLIAVSDLSLALLLSLYYQDEAGLSPLRAGLYLLPLSIAAIVGGPIAGRLTNRLSARVLSSAGAALHAVGLAGLAVSIALGLPDLLTLLVLGLTGFGTSLFTTPNTYAIMASLPETHRSVGNALRSTVQNAAGVAGTAFRHRLDHHPAHPRQPSRLDLVHLHKPARHTRPRLCASRSRFTHSWSATSPGPARGVTIARVTEKSGGCEQVSAPVSSRSPIPLPVRRWTEAKAIRPPPGASAQLTPATHPLLSKHRPTRRRPSCSRPNGGRRGRRSGRGSAAPNPRCRSGRLQ